MFGLGRKTRGAKGGDVAAETVEVPTSSPNVASAGADYSQNNLVAPLTSEDALFLDEAAEVEPANADETESYPPENVQEISEMQNDDIGSGHIELGASESPNADKAILHIGPGTVLKGDITTCESLVVQGNLNGTVEASLMLLAQGGVVDGTVNVQTAEIEGAFTGTLTVKGLLAVKGGGQIQGTVRYGELEIERGCQLNGDISQHDASSAERTTSGNVSRVPGRNPAGVKAA